jgi:5'-methylthioadenosine phosphorylase
VVDTGAEIGIFGGSGFYSFLDDVEVHDVVTPYGRPSAPVSVGTIAGRQVAFMPRHGIDHELPPHRVNYRANVWALRSLGVGAVFGPCAAGSLKPHLHPGELVVLDQIVDRTWGRADTFFDGPEAVHVSFADPYDPELGALACAAALAEGMVVHDRGTVVVIQGPRFSTRAESRWFRSMGWDTVNMTQHPEAYLARELGMRYCGLALVTDYDTGVETVERPVGGGVAPVTQDEVFAMFEANLDRLRSLLVRLVPMIPFELCRPGPPAGPMATAGG